MYNIKNFFFIYDMIYVTGCTRTTTVAFHKYYYIERAHIQIRVRKLGRRRISRLDGDCSQSASSFGRYL